MKEPGVLRSPSAIMTRYLSISLVLIASLLEAQAAIRLPLVIGDHMVLQRSIYASIWGWADPGEEILTLFRGQRKTARTGVDPPLLSEPTTGQYWTGS
jgi:hypothetical protein